MQYFYIKDNQMIDWEGLLQVLNRIVSTLIIVIVVCLSSLSTSDLKSLNRVTDFDLIQYSL